jgi:hypothetical protein
VDEFLEHFVLLMAPTLGACRFMDFP